MGESDTDSQGWSVESSEGTPTQAEQDHPLPNTPDVVAPPAESEEQREARLRDEKGRYAKSEDPPQEAAEGSSTPQEAAEPAKPAKRSLEARKHTFQQDIDHLTAQKREMQAEVERLRQEAERYRPPAPPPPVQPPQGEPFPSYDAWSTTHPDAPYEAYIDARADYRAEARIQAFQQETAAQQRAREAEQKTLTLRDKGKQVYNDWDDVFTGLDLHVPQPVWQTILTDPDGHRLAYELATHPETVYQMAQMDPLQIGVALGTLKARWAGEPAAPLASSRTHTAPPPIKPLGSSPTQPVVSLEDKPFDRWTEADLRKVYERDLKVRR